MQYDSLDDALNATGLRAEPSQDPAGLRVSRVCGHHLAPPYPCRHGCGSTIRQAWWKGDRIELVLDVEGPYPPGWVSPAWSSWWWTDHTGLIGRLASADSEHTGQELYVMHPCENRQYRPGATAPPSQPPNRKAPPPMTTPNDDPFSGGDKLPAVSFKDAPLNTTVVLVVTAAPKLVQARDYDTGKPDTWDDGNPKMTVVTEGTVNGEARSLWASKPSSMFSAIAEAQRTAGATVQPGGTLSIQFYDSEPNKDTKKAPRKLYRAHYAPPVVDAFSAPAAAPVAAAPAAASFPPVTAPAAAAAPPWAA